MWQSEMCVSDEHSSAGLMGSLQDFKDIFQHYSFYDFIIAVLANFGYYTPWDVQKTWKIN